MPDLELLKQQVARGAVVASQHAIEQAVRRQISEEEILRAIAGCELVEDYPEATYGPCCLIFGRSATGRPLHLVVTYPNADRVRIITAYEPDPALWIDYVTRKPKP